MSDRQEEIITELRRVASKLGKTSISRKEFASNSKINYTKVESAFGSWNKAIIAAGLQPNTEITISNPKITDEDLVNEMIRLKSELKKKPSTREMDDLGNYSSAVYEKRWGTWTKAINICFPDNKDIQIDDRTLNLKNAEENEKKNTDHNLQSRSKNTVVFGERIDFPGLRFAPVNEQGVVYLFGVIADKLGFDIESVRTKFPDCEGKRRLDKFGKKWAPVKIEFEFKSSNYRDHGHPLEEDNLLIVCWEHNWEDCPFDVIELKSKILELKSSLKG